MNKTYRILILMSLALVTAGGLRSADSTGTTTGTTTGTGTTGGTTGSGTGTGTTTTNTGNTTGTTTGTGTGTSTGTNTGTMTKKTPPGVEKRHTPNEHASDRAKAVQAMLLKFDASRETFMAERKALIAQLEAAKTEEEKKAILAELKTDMEARHEEQRTLRREIGEELKKLREQRKAGGGS